MCTQAVLPDMLRASSAPAADIPAQASAAQQHAQQHTQQHSQQHTRQHSGPYGLTDEEDDVDDGNVGDDQSEVPSDGALNENLAALQLQEDEQEGGRAVQQPAPPHVSPCLHPPPLPRQPMCRLFRYACGLRSLSTGRCKGSHAWCIVRAESCAKTAAYTPVEVPLCCVCGPLSTHIHSLPLQSGYVGLEHTLACSLQRFAQ